MLFVMLAVVVVVVGFAASRQVREPVARTTAVGASLVLGTMLLLGSVVTVIPAGHVGVVDIFGKVRDVGLQPGVRLVLPVARIHKMSTRTQEVTESADVPSSEGLVMHVDVSLLFNLDPVQAPEVYRTLGTNYEDILIIPQRRSRPRPSTRPVVRESPPD